MPISACYIVKNEQKNLPRSIKSLGGVISEIIVVDTGSTDSTVETAKGLGGAVSFFEWTGDFSAAKNYALSMASNEIVIFLDADEWFVPDLNENDREAIVRAFTADPSLMAIMAPINNINNNGSITNVNAAPRILRKSDGHSFHGRIHEYYSRNDGKNMKVVVSQGLKILHSGYTEDILNDKMLRNIELLENTINTSPSAEERHLAHCYLVREYLHANKVETSVSHLKAVLSQPEMIRRQFLFLESGFAALIYIMLRTVHSARNAFSRAELKRKLIEPFKKYLPKYPGSATIDLYFDCLFHRRDDILLRDIASALRSAESLPSGSNSYHFGAESYICRFAATALAKRGKTVEAMEYAFGSFKDIEELNASGLRILISCLRSVPPEEIILFLNSKFDATNPQKLAFLYEGTYVYGFKTVCSYYLNKKIQSSMATASEYLSIYLLLGNYSEGAQEALDLLADKGEAAKELVSENLFLAAVCSGDEAIYRDNSALLENYSQILDAFFSGAPLENPSDSDASLLFSLMEHVALFAGIERADALLGLLGEKYASPSYRALAKYCTENGLYNYYLSRARPAVIDNASARYMIDCLIFSGRYGEAFEFINGFIGKGVVDDALLQNLSAIADCALPSIKMRAEKLYNEYSRLLELFSDLTDVINTGYIFDESDKKRTRALKSLTVAQFKRRLELISSLPPLVGLAEVNEIAGAIYERRGFLANAVDCYCYALAKNHNPAKNREALSKIFKSLGNVQVKP